MAVRARLELLLPPDEAKALRERAVDVGAKMAGDAFRKRGNHTEIHVGRGWLAAMLAVAFELGYEARTRKEGAS